MQPRRPFQFRIATLMATVALAALAANWYARHRLIAAERTAEHNYILAASKYDVGTGLADAVHSTSVAWLNSALAVPNGEAAPAYAEHLRRMKRLESKERSFLNSGTWGSSIFDGGLERRIAKAAAWREEAEMWLSGWSSNQRRHTPKN
ncbi:MAG TPA: hypothetical protein PK867_04795 [Pirellulales bacterium]|nr:hypothetical protein [Pirellulales bacterium]